MADRSWYHQNALLGLADHAGDESLYSHMVWLTGGSVNLLADVQIGAVEIKDHDSAIRLDVETVTAKNALYDRSEDGAHVALGATTDAVVAAGAVGSVSAKLRRLTTDTDAIKTAVEAIDNTIYDEDSPHTTEDDGTFVLAVRNDSGSAMAGDGDYIPFAVDSSGRLYVNAEALDKDTDEVLVWANTAKDGSGTDYVPLVDNDGHLQIDVLSSIISSGSVDILSVPAPLNVVGGGAEAAALRVTIANDSTGLLSIDDNGGSLTVDGTVAVSSGSINLFANDGVDIGDVDVASMPADTFVAEDGALGLGVLLQGDDGTDRHNLQTDASGYLKTIAQAADGVDIGNVDVASIGALEQTTPTLYNLTLTSADTEYIQALPANTRALQFQCRTAYDVRYAFETGKVATPTAPYSTLKNPSVWYKENILTSGSLYLASSEAGVIAEIEAWATV